MRSEDMRIVYELDTFRFSQAWEEIVHLIKEQGFPLGGYKLNEEESLDLEQIGRRLDPDRTKAFNLQGHGLEFESGCVRNSHLDFLQVQSDSETTLPWDDCAAKFIGSPHFVMAWVADTEYEFWQNAEDLLHYTSRGKPYEHLPQKSNELPYPLERTIIDISANPGRTIFREGYFEVVGSLMWLGEPFWKLAGTEKSKVQNTDWLSISKPLPSVLRIEAYPKNFTTDVGEEGKLQRKLRSLLFNVS